jgi:ATP-dependent RNA helicase DbpA
MSDILFSVLPLSSALIANLETLNYHKMTPIQEQSLPKILEGRDLIAKAKTGSGKTAAFAIGLIEKLIIRNYAPQALVLCPTRELGAQVANEIRRLVRFQSNIKVLTLCGGQPIGPQIGSLEYGAHILVATPGRLKDHLRRKSVSLGKIKTLVLDEADRMLDMGFHDDIEGIIQQTPANRQTLLFSATYPDGIKQLSADFQKNPIEISVEALPTGNQIKQLFYQIDQTTKKKALTQLLNHYQPVSSVIFCNTKALCRELNDYLKHQGFSSLALHGDLEQRERDQVLVQFSNKSCSILVATDVAARGLDIKDLAAVINYDLFPQPDVYIHRIGRTGRAGKEGLALSLYSKREEYKLEAIKEFQGKKLQREQITSLPEPSEASRLPPMVTLCISGGKKQKVRPGDILGALTGEAGIPGQNVGKIDIFVHFAYVAIKRNSAKKALERLNNGKIKGRFFKVRQI